MIIGYDERIRPAGLLPVGILVQSLAACGTASAGPQDALFEIHEVEVGHPTASVLMLDQDGDARMDVVATGGGTLTLLRGDGEGRLTVHESVPAGDNPVDVVAGDLDEDGWTDLAIANHETTYVTLLFGSPSGFGAREGQRLPVDVSPHPHAVRLADVDGDGHLDLIVDDRDREQLRVFHGRGDGSFTTGISIAVGGDPYRGMTLADLDGDGDIDVITPNPRSVAIRLGDGAGGYTPGMDLASPAVPPFSTVVGDFDGDGVPDIAAGSGEGPGRLAVWHGRGDGSFVSDPDAPYEIADGPTKLGVANVDGDARDDVLVTSYLGNEVAVAFGDAEGLRIVRMEIDDYPWDVDVGDLNGDGRMDLVVARDGGEWIAVLLGRNGM